MSKSGNDAFPTRHYPYRRSPSGEVAAASVVAMLPQRIHRFVLGLDRGGPKPLEGDELLALDDPFGRLLRSGTFPMTGRALLTALDTGAILPTTRSFVVGDGSQIPWTEAPEVRRAIRIAITRSASPGANPDILISTAPSLDDPAVFLQVIGWDDSHGRFHYYERRRGTWVWAGDSFHALSAPTRGQGPFDSHVNGSVVMKELKAPWVHWSSESARVRDGAFVPTDPFMNEPLWRNHVGAEIFEQNVARAGLSRWTKSRFDQKTVAGTIQDAHEMLRQVVDTTTVNLASSQVLGSRLETVGDVALPGTFFADLDGLIDGLGLDVDIEPIAVSGVEYKKQLTDVGTRIIDTESGWEREGDTHFAFVVPERALEDIVVGNELVARGFVSERLMAAVLAVDLPNPVYSARRASLLGLFPNTLDGNVEALEELVLEHARSAPATPATRELGMLWDEFSRRGWQAVVAERLRAYTSRIRARARTPEGVADLVRLADGRRRRFRDSSLAEFSLTVPTTNLPPSTAKLSMQPDGTLEEQP